MLIERSKRQKRQQETWSILSLNARSVVFAEAPLSFPSKEAKKQKQKAKAAKGDLVISVPNREVKGLC